MRITVAFAGLTVFLMVGSLAHGQSSHPAGATEDRAVTLYVSPKGKAGWSGLAAKPVADAAGKITDGPLPTVHAARDAIRQRRARGEWVGKPIRVLIAPSIYFMAEPLVLEPEDSGSPTAPISYEAQPGGKVLLSGGRMLGGFEQGQVDGKPCWTLDLPEVKKGDWYFQQLFANGQRRPRTRLPREGYYRFAMSPAVSTTQPWNQGHPMAAYVPGELKPWRNLNDVEIVALHFWVESHLVPAELDEQQHLVKFRAPSVFRLTDAQTDKKMARYYVENVREALDTPGQWYLDRAEGRLYCLALPSETAGPLAVIAPKLDHLVQIRGTAERPVSNVRFSGLHLAHTNWQLPADSAGAVQAAWSVPGAITMQHARNCELRDCAVQHVSTYAVEIGEGCRECGVVNCELTDMGGGGVKLGHGSSKSIVHNTEIGPGGQIFLSAVGIWIGNSGDNTITHNHIHDLTYTGISVGWSWGYAESPAINNVIEYNHIHDIGKGLLGDMGGIYTLGVSPGTRLRYNRIHDIEAYPYGGWGIYNDEGSTDILVENNIVYRTTHGGYHQHYGKNNMLRNNIFAFGREGQIIRTRNEEHLSFTFERNIVLFSEGKLLGSNWANGQFRLDHNLYYHTRGADFDFAGKSFADWQQAGQDQHSIIADPLFANSAQGDFSFKGDSPALKIGFQPIDASRIGRIPEK